MAAKLNHNYIQINTFNALLAIICSRIKNTRIIQKSTPLSKHISGRRPNYNAHCKFLPLTARRKINQNSRRRPHMLFSLGLSEAWLLMSESLPPQWQPGPDDHYLNLVSKLNKMQIEYYQIGLGIRFENQGKRGYLRKTGTSMFTIDQKDIRTFCRCGDLSHLLIWVFIMQKILGVKDWGDCPQFGSSFSVEQEQAARCLRSPAKESAIFGIGTMRCSLLFAKDS